MRSQPVRSEASRQRAEGQFKAGKKADAETPRAGDALRHAEAEKRRACARFGWQRKQPTGIPQSARQRQR
jgi:hypothetical protein